MQPRRHHRRLPFCRPPSSPSFLLATPSDTLFGFSVCSVSAELGRLTHADSHHRHAAPHTPPSGTVGPPMTLPRLPCFLRSFPCLVSLFPSAAACGSSPPISTPAGHQQPPHTTTDTIHHQPYTFPPHLLESGKIVDWERLRPKSQINFIVATLSINFGRYCKLKVKNQGFYISY
uniref:Uncharacterized protein n=1 Tax=Opuntia streptacantha TaxID=393608 RepID=A0A7C8YWC9_OPUST